MFRVGEGMWRSYFYVYRCKYLCVNFLEMVSLLLLALGMIALNKSLSIYVFPSQYQDLTFKQRMPLRVISKDLVRNSQHLNWPLNKWLP